jgi:DNA-binding transcriptional LysR family regulator
MAEMVDWSGHIGRRLRLRDLHVFAQVVQFGSMAKAAAQMRVTQPAVSQVIADLESALGVSLLDRSPRGVRPTIYGEALIKGGAAAFDDLRQAIREIEFLANPTSGEVRIGCPETVAALMTPVVKRLSAQYPGIVLHVFEVAAPTLDLPQLRDRTLDLAMIRVAGPPSALW